MSETRPVDALVVWQTRDWLLELAAHQATIVNLDPAPDPDHARRPPPGARLPPGLAEILTADEIRAHLAAVTDWAHFAAHVLADETGPVIVPDGTVLRLRLIAEPAHVRHFLGHDDELLALAFVDDVAALLRQARRLAGRAVRQIRTGTKCPDPGCAGHLYCGLSDDRTDTALHCNRCGQRVPFATWSRWPHARVAWITAEHAARLLGIEVNAVRVRAHRNRWRRVGTGRDVRYNTEDVKGDVAGAEDNTRPDTPKNHNSVTSDAGSW